MSALPEPQQHYSLNDYFALETTDNQRHEYYRGEIFAMSGGSANHNRISVTMATALEFAQNRTDLITNPTVIVEVLSPSTENYDRGKKFSFFYRMIETLRDYVLIDQDRVLVEHFRRSDERSWLFTVLDDLSETLVLESIDVSIPVSEIYRRVDWQM